MTELGIGYRRSRVTALLRGRCQKKTACIVLCNNKCQNRMIQMNSTVRKNIGVCVGDTVTIISFPKVRNGKNIHVIPVPNSVQASKSDSNNKSVAKANLEPSSVSLPTLSFEINFVEKYLQPFFMQRQNNCPVHEGDSFLIQGQGSGKDSDIEFQVVRTDPSPFCMVTPQTRIHCNQNVNKPIDEKLDLEKINRDFDFGSNQSTFIEPHAHPHPDFSTESAAVESSIVGAKAALKKKPLKRHNLDEFFVKTAKNLKCLQAEKLTTEKQIQPEASTLLERKRLAYFLFKKGEFEESTKLYSDIIAAEDKEFGPDNLNTMETKLALGYVLHLQYKDKEALDILCDVFIQQEKRFGSKHLQTLKTKVQMAWLYVSMNDLKTAVHMTRQILRLEQDSEIALDLHREDSKVFDDDDFRKVFESCRDLMFVNLGSEVGQKVVLTNDYDILTMKNNQVLVTDNDHISTTELPL